MQQPPKFFIKTFGCQMNVADSERMAALLTEQGMKSTDQVEEAEVILLNGCTVREKAVHKAISTLGKYKKIQQTELNREENFLPTEKLTKKKPIIGIGGCVGQLEKQNLFTQVPSLDFVFGTDAIDQLPEILHQVRSGGKHLVYTDFDRSRDYSTETKIHGRKSQAFVNIMKGCDKFCTYCIVPFTRGREKSRIIDEVVDDIAKLVAAGVKEVTLLGQNVNSFGKGNPNVKQREPQSLHNIIGKVGPNTGEENFPQLLRAIDQDPRCSDLKRIRFTSSHPLDFSDELIQCYASAAQGGVSKLASHLHLPVQSGSNRILQKMGRHHQIENYILQMDQLRSLNPHVGITTDLIVGFPTETEEDFQATLHLLDRIQYDNVFAFAYSPRPGTRASKIPDDVPDEVKNDRLNRLLKHQLEISARRFQQSLGQVMEILVEGEAKNQNLLDSVQPDSQLKVWMGRTSCSRIVNFIADSRRNLIGQLLPVKITGASRLSLQGEVIIDPSFAEAFNQFDAQRTSEVVS